MGAIKDLKANALQHLPPFEVDDLLCHALEISKTELYLSPNAEINFEKSSKFQKLLMRRILGEPLAYLFGTWEFYGNEFYVTKDTLVPRPETELIVDKSVELPDKSLRVKPFIIADFGAGSGCLGLSLLKIFSNARLLSIDISEKSLEVVKNNASKHSLLDRTEIIKTDLSQQHISELKDFEEKVELVVANPPYVAINDPNLDKNVKNFEPHLALFSGVTGLEYFKPWAEAAKKLLKPGGHVFFEMGFNQSKEVREIFEKLNFHDLEIISDLQGHPRIIKGKR